MTLSRTTTVRFRYDAQEANVSNILRRELQAAKIISLSVASDYATVELAPSTRRKSTILFCGKVSNVPVTVVEDHSALLPVWLDQFQREKDLLEVHVDRHSDLGMPNVLLVDGKHIDRFSGCDVNPIIPASVALAVDSTAIEIGNFLTIALKWLSIKTLVWIHPFDLKPVTKGIGLRLGWTGIDPLLSSERRFKADPVSGGDFDVSLHILSRFYDLKSVLASNNDLGIILDIDLDYFDNSHEALDQQQPMPVLEFLDSTWLEEQKRVVDALFDMIPAERLRSVGIARSPGFCPPKVADALVKLVIDRLAAQGATTKQ